MRQVKARAVDDACPGALRPHHAADGELLRLRVPGGALAPSVLRALVAASGEFADGRVGLTSRANVQLRGVAAEHVDRLVERIRAAGLLPDVEHERVRNVLASPLSGRGPASRDDVDPLVGELDAAVCARPGLAELPGRFLFGLDDGSGDIAAERPDVLAGALGGGRFVVAVDGSRSGIEVGRGKVVATVLKLAEAFLAERLAAHSRAWRVRELPDGAARVVTRVVGERTRFVSVPAASGAGGLPEPGLVEQRDGRLALVAVVPLALLEPAQADALNAVAGLSASAPNLRVTPWRRVVVRDLDRPAALAGRDLLDAHGLVVTPGTAWSRLTACAGRPGCAKSLADVHADARAFAPGCAPAGVPVHWVGCERACGTPSGEVALLVARPGGGYEHSGAPLAAAGLPRVTTGALR